MRLQIISDLHIDHDGFNERLLQEANADAVIIAGDTCQGVARAITWLRRVFPFTTPVIVVPGNHEFYWSSIPEQLAEGRHAAAHLGITLLENSFVILDDPYDPGRRIQITGATLWTDFKLNGWPTQFTAMQAARRQMNDYRVIARDDASSRFRPEDAQARFARSAQAIEEHLSLDLDVAAAVVVTHFAPHPLSIDPRFVGSALNAAFCSDLSGLIARRQPALWVHGHVHCSNDYRIGETRIVSNPRGYGRENPSFNPSFIVEV